MGKTLTVCGKRQTDAAAIPAGDIGAVAKLSTAKTGDTLCDPARVVSLLCAPPTRPPATAWRSRSPKKATRARSPARWPA